MKQEILLKATGKRLDQSLLEQLHLEEKKVTRSELTRMIGEKRIFFLDGSPIPKAGYKLDHSITLVLDWPDPMQTEQKAEDLPLDLIYEDEHLLVVNKPQGLVVHPAPGHKQGTLVNALLHYCGSDLAQAGGEQRPGIVHRIDKDTSGLLVVAKSNLVHQRLSSALAKHEIQRIYFAAVYGTFAEQTGRIEAPIGRDPKNRQKMAVVSSGKNAITHFEVLESLAGCSLLRCRLETGRTHQIRVHLQFVGHPVVADPLYAKGRKNYGLSGQLLHAGELHFKHPITGEQLDLYAGLPAYFEDFLASVR